jgi:electron transport complex protein RnfE
MAKSIVQEFTKGLWDEVPPFRLVLGLCPALAVTKTVENGIGMGLATTFVLLCSNVLVSLLRNVIPAKVRIACFIIIIASFVTIVELLMQAFTYPLFLKLGIFIPLIVVNCIVLGRAEAFASKNNLLRSALDGLGIGIGFTLALATLAAVRELLGTGALTFYETPIPIFGASYEPFSFMVEAPGAFVGLGLILAVMNILGKK